MTRPFAAASIAAFITLFALIAAPAKAQDLTLTVSTPYPSEASQPSNSFGAGATQENSNADSASGSNATSTDSATNVGTSPTLTSGIESKDGRTPAGKSDLPTSTDPKLYDQVFGPSTLSNSTPTKVNPSPAPPPVTLDYFQADKPIPTLASIPATCAKGRNCARDYDRAQRLIGAYNLLLEHPAETEPFYQPLIAQANQEIAELYPTLPFEKKWTLTQGLQQWSQQPLANRQQPSPELVEKWVQGPPLQLGIKDVAAAIRTRALHLGSLARSGALLIADLPNDTAKQYTRGPGEKKIRSCISHGWIDCFLQGISILNPIHSAAADIWDDIVNGVANFLGLSGGGLQEIRGIGTTLGVAASAKAVIGVEVSGGVSLALLKNPNAYPELAVFVAPGIDLSLGADVEADVGLSVSTDGYFAGTRNQSCQANSFTGQSLKNGAEVSANFILGSTISNFTSRGLNEDEFHPWLNRIHNFLTADSQIDRTLAYRDQVFDEYKKGRWCLADKWCAGQTPYDCSQGDYQGSPYPGKTYDQVRAMVEERAVILHALATDRSSIRTSVSAQSNNELKNISSVSSIVPYTKSRTTITDRTFNTRRTTTLTINACPNRNTPETYWNLTKLVNNDLSQVANSYAGAPDPDEQTHQKKLAFFLNKKIEEIKRQIQNRFRGDNFASLASADIFGGCKVSNSSISINIGGGGGVSTKVGWNTTLLLLRYGDRDIDDFVSQLKQVDNATTAKKISGICRATAVQLAKVFTSLFSAGVNAARLAFCLLPHIGDDFYRNSKALSGQRVAASDHLSDYWSNLCRMKDDDYSYLLYK